MLNFVLCFLLISSISYGFFNNSLSEVSASALSCCTTAVELAIYLSGAMALWGGLMRIAEKSGLTAKISCLLSPIIRILFKGIARDSKEYSLISMNITSNLLGLGNAATPLGIQATRELAKSEKSSGMPTRNISTF